MTSGSFQLAERMEVPERGTLSHMPCSVQLFTWLSPVPFVMAFRINPEQTSKHEELFLPLCSGAALAN